MQSARALKFSSTCPAHVDEIHVYKLQDAKTESYVTGQCEHGCGKSKVTDQDSSSLSSRGLSVSLSRIAKYYCPMLELLTNSSAMFSSLMVSVRAL